MKTIRFIIYGILFGAANAIPGVSGGTIAVILNYYDILMDALSLDFKKIKENINLLIPLAIGIAIGIIGVSKLMAILLTHFPSQTYFAFIGVVVGSVPLILYNAKKVGDIKKVNYIPFIITFIIMVAFAFVGKSTGGVKYTTLNIESFVVCLLAMAIGSMTMVIPGVSGALTLTIFGMYETIFGFVFGSISLENILKVFTDFMHLFSNPLSLLIPCGIGGIIGLVGGAKLVKIALNKFPQATYMAILGLLIGSIVQLLKNADIFKQNIIAILTSIICAIVMGIIVYLFSKDEIKRDKE